MGHPPRNSRPPGAVLSEGEYQLLDSIRLRMDTLQDVQKSQGERIEALEDAESKRDETLERIETKLDGLHEKDADHDARLDKLHEQVAESAGVAAGEAAQKSLVKAGKWGALIVALLGTIDQWGPFVLKALGLWIGHGQ